MVALIALLIGATFVLGCARAATPGLDSPRGSPIASPLPGLAPESPVERALVVRVVDGDTIIVDRGLGPERVRYIGIDTPESAIPDRTPEPFGPEADAANATLLTGGVVHLERDVSETDRFGRLLRYVWLRDEGDPDGWTLVNLQLVADGWATVTTFPPDVRHAERFVAAQGLARDAARGIWSSDPSVAP